jgi:hypothetical protein
MVQFDWSNAVHRLSSVQASDYFNKRAMPQFVEPLVTELVKYFSSCTDLHRQQLLSTTSRELSTVLGWYARKLAGRAVRDHSREDLRNGLVALAIDAGIADPRDATATLAILHNSALHLNEDPKSLIEQAARISTQLVVKYFTAFLNAPLDQKAISNFGFSEGMGPSGFDYLPLLAEYGGPTPFDRQ